MPKAEAGRPALRVNFEFRRKLAEKIEGNLVNFCYQCGACVGDCPAATYSGGAFNPREIMLRVLYGTSEEFLKEDSIVWDCTNCYNCHERCPQEVKPVEVIIAIKNLMADEGLTPIRVQKVIREFETSGRTVPAGPAVNRKRESFGLPPLSPVPMDDIRNIIEPGENGGDS